MPTNAPVQVGPSFSAIQTGPWSGSIQNVGNTPLVGTVLLNENTPPDTDGGFAIYSPPVAIEIADGETLWVRAVGTVGAVVLA